ncbi:unnamed protein product [Linum trigynum]|uniref:Retrotransposon Copia-like N-terminal domain-containing protein n=1 Tax=Linum trigynum TaxID=586398 RepID=A0AAV2CJ94_9ROSI
MMNTPSTRNHGRPQSSGNGSAGITGSGVQGVQFGTCTDKQGNQQQFTSGPRSEVITFGNPYYLNPNEALNQSIGTEVFDGTNYTMWSRSVVMGLKMKHKLGVHRWEYPNSSSD